MFTISLDFELIWGTLDKPKWRRHRRLCLEARQEIVGRLLEMFHEYDVSATWCTVGHLFLDHCGPHRRLMEADASGSGPRDVRLDRDPGSSEAEDPVFYGRQLIDRILACPTPQEIGCHSFTHPNFARCSRARADAELAACVETAGERGLQLRSFVFPRNRVGHVDLLPQHGFSVFRGPDPRWYERVAVRRWYHRLGHLADVLIAATPPTVLPEWNDAGLWDLKGSMLYTPSHGIRRLVPVSLRVRRARKGLMAAARTRRIFHLWFHPVDLVIRREAMLEGLRQILEDAQELRERRQLAILPMSEIPPAVHPQAPHSTVQGKARG